MSNVRKKRLEKEARSLADRVIKGIAEPSSHHRQSLIPVLEDFMGKYGDFHNLNEGVEKGSSASWLAMRSGYGDVLDAFASFTSSIWSDEDISKFEARKWDDGRPREPRADLIDIVSLKKEKDKKKNRYLRWLAYNIFMVLHTNLNKLLYRTGPVNFEKDPSKGGKWPFSPSQFIPYGAERAVIACTKWARLMGNPVPLAILSNLSHLCPSLTPVMTQNQDMLIVIKELVQQLSVSVKDQTMLDSDEDTHIVITQHSLHFRSILTGAWFMEPLHAFDESFILRNLETLTTLYHTICDMLPHFQNVIFPFEGTEDDVVGMFTSVAFHIYQGTFIAPTPLPAHPCLPLDKLRHPENPEDWFTFEEILSNTGSMQNQRECTELSCTRTGEDTRTNLRLCASCQVVRYCSRECQKSDWKEHKPVCKLLKVVLEIHKQYITSKFDDVRTNQGPESPVTDEERLIAMSGLSKEDVRLVGRYLGQRAEHLRPIGARINAIGEDGDLGTEAPES